MHLTPPLAQPSRTPPSSWLSRSTAAAARGANRKTLAGRGPGARPVRSTLAPLPPLVGTKCCPARRGAPPTGPSARAHSYLGARGRQRVVVPAATRHSAPRSSPRPSRALPTLPLPSLSARTLPEHSLPPRPPPRALPTLTPTTSDAPPLCRVLACPDPRCRCTSLEVRAASPAADRRGPTVCWELPLASRRFSRSPAPPPFRSPFAPPPAPTRLSIAFVVRRAQPTFPLPPQGSSFLVHHRPALCRRHGHGHSRVEPAAPAAQVAPARAPVVGAPPPLGVGGGPRGRRAAAAAATTPPAPHPVAVVFDASTAVAVDAVDAVDAVVVVGSVDATVAHGGAARCGGVTRGGGCWGQGCCAGQGAAAGARRGGGGATACRRCGGGHG